MKYGRLAPAMAAAFVLGAALLASGARAQAGEGRGVAADPTKAPLHRGQVSRTPGGVFESVFSADGIRVYLYTPEGAPAMVEGAAGTALITRAGGKPVPVKLAMEVPGKEEESVYFCPMHPEVVQKTPGECAKCGGMKLYIQNRLFGAADLAKAAPGSVAAEVTVRGLPGKEKQATFTASNEAPTQAPAGKASPHGTAPPRPAGTTGK